MSFENDQGEGSTIKLLYQYSKGTVKLDFKELFIDYQLFYTINLLLNKELLPI